MKDRLLEWKVRPDFSGILAKNGDGDEIVDSFVIEPSRKRQKT